VANLLPNHGQNKSAIIMNMVEILVLQT